MIPLSIRMANFLSYRDETPVFDFTTFHVACLSGDNGAGKSSFLEAMHWALWGEARLRDTEIITRGAEKMFVEFVFQVNDSVYRINRSFAKSGRSGHRLELYQALDEARTRWETLSGSSIRETQAKITDEIVGMSYEVFANSAYLRQGKADSFTQLAPTERRDLLAEMLEIDRYNAFKERAKTRKDHAAQQVAALNSQIGVDEETVAQIPVLESQLDDAERRVTTARAFVEYARAALARQSARQLMQERGIQLQHYSQRRSDITAEHAALTAVLSQRDAIEAQYARLVAVEQAHAAAHHLRERHDALIAERQHIDTALNAKRATLQRTLDRAGAEREQLILALATADTIAAELAALRAAHRDAATHDTRWDDVRTAIEQQTQQLRLLERDIDRRNTVAREHAETAAALTQAMERSAGLAAVQTQISAAEAAAAEIETLQAEHATLNATVAGLNSDRAQVSEQGKSIRAKIDALQVQQHCPTCHGVMDETHVATAKATLEQELTTLRESYNQHGGALRTAQARMEEITAAIATLRTTVAPLPELRRRATVLGAAQAETDRLQAHVAALTSTLASLDATDHASAIETTRAALATLSAERDALTHARATAAAQQQRISQLEAERERIDTQQARLIVLDTKIAEFEADLAQDRLDPVAQARRAELESAITELGYDPQSLASLWNELQTLLPAREQHAALAVTETKAAASLQRLHDTEEQITLTTQSHEQATHEYERLDALCTSLQSQLVGKELSAAPAQLVTQAEHELSSRVDYASQLRVKQQTAYAAQARIEALRAQVQVHSTAATRYQILEQAFASKGIQAMLIREFAIPVLERETNRILSEMTNNQLYLNFETQMNTQAGNQRETLEIRVSDASGTRPLEAFSGGEAFRISFALRIALSKILAHRAGHRLETLIIDEGFGTQDAAGRERLVEAINAISGEFKTILVITHVQEVRDLFPVQIIIRRGETGSQWEILS